MFFLCNSKRLIIILSTAMMLLFSTVTFCKQPLTITFVPEYNNNPVLLNGFEYQNSNLEIFVIKTLKFYVSEIKLMNENQVVYTENESFHLIDAGKLNAAESKLTIPDKIEFSGIEFNLGIDSITSVSGAYGGDLDPTNGMYWTWQSGYINFKFEGTSGSQRNKFEFHLGGYQSPFNALQVIKLPLNHSGTEVTIALNLNKLLEVIDLKNDPDIMSPSFEAVRLSKHIATCFYIKQE